VAFPHPLNWRSTLLGVLLLFAPSLAGAQVNIEKIRDRGHEEGLAATVKLDLATRSGNVDVTRLDTDVRVDFVANQTVSFVLIRGGFGWINGERFSNEALAHARLSYGMSTRVGAEAFGRSITTNPGCSIFVRSPVRVFERRSSTRTICD